MNESQLTNERPGAGGCLHELEWLGAGFVLPCTSPTFYRLAVRRRVISAILFFLLFALVITGLTTIRVGKTLLSASEDIQQLFEQGDFPEITIEDGVATVDAAQPLVPFDEEGRVVIIDTTGTYKAIDRSRYHQGFLLTRTSLHILNEGEYQEVPLSELHEIFDTNPIVINADSVTRLWSSLSLILAALTFLGLAIWNMVVWLMYLALLGLVFWGVVSLVRPGTDFGPILITGLYAFIPAVYAHYLLGRLGLRFFGLQTILLLLMWTVTLVAAFAERIGGILLGGRPLRGWRALIGVPMLLVFALDVIFHWSKGAFIVWPMALLTFFAVLGISLWMARDSEQLETP